MEAHKSAVLDNAKLKDAARSLCDKKGNPPGYIRTTRHLLEELYKSVTVIRLPMVPYEGRYMLMDAQIRELYSKVKQQCNSSYQHKRDVRMAIDAEDLPLYIHKAYEHFSKDIDTAFDILEAAKQSASPPQGFSEHLLEVLESLYGTMEMSLSSIPPKATSIEKLLVDLSPLIASSIVLVATRDNKQGIQDQVVGEPLWSVTNNCNQGSDNTRRYSRVPTKGSFSDASLTSATEP